MNDYNPKTVPILAQFGSMSNHGLLFAKTFAASGVGDAVTEPPDALPRDGEFWLWAHLDLVDRRAGLWLAQIGLPDDICDFMTSDDVRQMADYEGRILYGTVFEPSDETLHYKSRQGLLRFVVSRRWIITGRFNPVGAIETLKLRVERGERFSEPMDVLARLVSGFHRRLQDQTGKMQSSVDHIEDRVIDSGGVEFSATIADIRRNAANVLRQIAHYHHVQHDIANTLPRLKFPEKHAEQAIDTLERFESLRGDIQSLLERARLIKEEMSSNLAMQMNQSLYVLSLISAMLLPPSVVFSLFGINVGGLPFLHDEMGFVMVVMVGLLSASLVFLILRRRK